MPSRARIDDSLAAQHAIERGSTRVGRAARRAALVSNLGLLVSLPASLAAQPSPRVANRPASYVHEQWTVENGLPVNSIHQIIQTRQGYIWLVTLDGLARFDGIRFTVYNSANTPGLTTNRFVQVREAADGILWLLSEQGEVFQFRGDRAERFTLPGATPDEAITGLIADSVSNIVWAMTTRGLWAVRAGRGSPTLERMLDRRVTALLRRRNGILWAGTPSGLYRIDGTTRGKVVVGNALDTERVTALSEDSAGTLWVGTANATWIETNESFKRLTPRGAPLVNVFVIQPGTSGSADVFAQNGVYRADSGIVRPVHLSLSSRLEWVTWSANVAPWYTVGSDLYVHGRLVYSAREANPTKSVASPVPIRTLLVDREGSAWFGTERSGLHRLKPALFSVYSEAEGLPYRNAYTVYADRSGDIWAGTWQGGFGLIEPRINRLTNFPAARSIVPFVNSLAEDDDGNLWVGSGTALAICARPAMTCRGQPASDSSPGATFALYLASNKRMWIGAGNGLFRAHQGRYERMTPNAGAPSALVRAFVETRDSALWMGTNGAGLYRFHNDVFTKIGTKDGLPTDLIRSLYQDKDGWLWVGTEGRGLVRLNPRELGAARPASARDGRIAHIGSADGLFDDVIHQILEDDFGRFWMSTNRGIFWVSRAELIAFADGRVSRVHSTSYTERDGLRNREANGGVQPAGAKTPDGSLWFPTQDGVAVVDPARVAERRSPPPVVVEQVLSKGKPLPRDSGRVIVAVEERDVQVEFTALTYLEPTNVRFRYRLEGYDRDWVDAGNRRTAFYTRLTPGTHRFHVNASDALGNWSEPGAAIDIRVLPRLVETTAFRALVVAALVLLTFGGLRWRVAQLNTRARALELAVVERTAALRQHEQQLAEQNVRLETQAEELKSLDHAKTRFFANVSHELRTPLTLIIGPLDDLRAQVGGEPKAERWLDIASSNARRLLRLVNQILDVAKLDAKQVRLTLRPLDLVPFTRGVVSVFAPVAERKLIRMTIVAPDAIVGGFDADAIEKILTNLLSNAIKFTPSGGTVDISLSRDATAAKIVVRDSGPGIPHDQLTHVFERFYQADETNARTQPGTGIGLSLTKELVELHGGTIGVASDSGGTAFTAVIAVGSIANANASNGASATAALAPAMVVTDEHGDTQLALRDEADVASDDVPTLLIVDDSADLRAYIRAHLEGEFRVFEGRDGAEGIALAKQLVPDVVISDVMMPGTDGHELVRTLRTSPETDFLPIILLTAQAEDEQKIAGLERGADDYLVKPFEVRELQLRIRNLIESRRRLRRHFRASPPPASARPIPGLSATDQTFAERVRTAIHQSFSNPDFGVAELANAVAQDRSHLFRRVREVFGESPSDLIRRTRLDHAVRLLSEGDGNVADVAYAVGFNSVSHFYRAFQAAYGATPAAYRDRATRP